MSWYPSEEPSRQTMQNWQDYNFCQPTPDTTTSQDNHEQNNYSNERWSAAESSIQDPYTISQPMPWPSEAPRGLGLESFHTPTQAIFNSHYSVSNDLAASVSWPCSAASLVSPVAHQDSSQYCSALDQWYPTSTTMSSSTGWEAVPGYTRPSNLPACEASPRHSNYSISSASSVVASSPYAHSDGCLQPVSPPNIKQEDPVDRSRDRLYSIPGLAPSTQPSHVNPGDIYATPPLSAAEQASFAGIFAQTKVGVEDTKPMADAGSSTPRRALSKEDSRSPGSDARVKRGYTTHANSTCECDKCGKLFQRSYNLKAHMETHDPEREQPHACPYTDCKRRFVRRTDLIRHEQSVHLKTRNFHCPMCFSAFARKDTLRRHVDDGCPRREQVRKRGDRFKPSAAPHDTSQLLSQQTPTAFMIPKTEPF
ncbi:Cell wall transcription factor ACE2 [Pseudocercospora fuligena]|uniref:C2H2 type master regulator of conidiophore development brlA n=1 Tax=Pseudocercospora fuligena TaxID=685502 RepID=A0A8H6RLD3_9PEZI|nr:Cell wall transcription factor ACE2 [Pseudocercospora fuligena]